MINGLSLKNHRKDGKFAKGNNANPAGTNGFTSINSLIEALKKHGKNQNQDFWDMVALKSWTSETVLVALLKKLIPDKIQGEGFANGTFVYIVRDSKKSDNNREQICSTLESAKNQG